jgi:hypothetical protein
MLRAADPVAARDALPQDLSDVDRAGLRVAALLVARLRFDRLLQSQPTQRARYIADPEGWTARFRQWHADTPAHPDSEEGPPR